MKDLIVALRVFLALTILTGIVYPFLMTGIAQVAFPNQANGSLVREYGQIVGSALIGQQFDDPSYFWGRPSATSPETYNAASSAGSNLGPTNPQLMIRIKQRIAELKSVDPTNTKPIPTDLVTASASGLDPHISIRAAEYQISRVSRLRGIPESKILELVKRSTEERSLGMFGEPVVNVLELNLVLDSS